MKKILFLLVIFFSSMTMNAKRTIESMNLNNNGWEKCEIVMNSNYTYGIITIDTKERQCYTFNHIESYVDKIKGIAIDNKGKEVYIVMYFKKDFTYMIIRQNNNIIEYLIR